MIHLRDHAFFNFEGQRSLSLLALFGLFLGGHGNRRRDQFLPLFLVGHRRVLTGISTT
jgi:hypothetical protein